MKFQLLPSSFGIDGCASPRQHLACFVINDCVSIDAGSLAMAASGEQRRNIRDIVLTHAHLDHIAGLPLFIDDLFAGLSEPVRIHAAKEVIEVLERDIFNWSIYPRFSELCNENGAIMEYKAFENDREFRVCDLRFVAVGVNHKVPSIGLIVSDDETSLAITGDTAEMDGFWNKVNDLERLDVLLIECAFPNELKGLANASHHLTPDCLRSEISKFRHENCPIYVINIKPMYYEEVVAQLAGLNIKNLQILEVGKVYEW